MSQNDKPPTGSTVPEAPTQPDATPETPEGRKRFRLAMPHTYLLLLMIIALAGVLTYFIPAGEFDRYEDPETGRTLVQPDTFHSVPQNPQNPFDWFAAVPAGMEQAAYIIFFVFIVGGAFGIIEATGAVDRGINAVISRMRGREIWSIPLIMLVFGASGAFMGFAEELLPFYPVMVALAIKMGFDTVTGVSIVMLGAGAGFAGAMTNPFTIGVAQGIAELPLFSGLWYRAIMFSVMMIATIVWVMLHARAVKKDPSRSPTPDLDERYRQHAAASDVGEVSVSRRHIFVGLAFLAGLIAIAIGVSTAEWYITEISTVFLITGIVCGLIGGMTPNKVFDEFVSGAQKMVFGALLIGVAAGVIVVMENGQVLDPIVQGMASAISTLPQALSAVGMFIVQWLLNILIPSGSGQAAVSMPVMVPVSDLLGITRQTAVVAFQFGDGIMNVLTPTSATLMAGLALSGVPWQHWAKFAWKIVLIWTLIAAAFVAIGSVIHLGPF